MFKIPKQKMNYDIPLNDLCTSTCFRFAGLIYPAKEQEKEQGDLFCFLQQDYQAPATTCTTNLVVSTLFYSLQSRYN